MSQPPTYPLPSARLLRIEAVDPGALERIPPGAFAAIVPAYGGAEQERVLAMAHALIERGCRELACVGPNAGELEDLLDWIIIDLELPYVVMTTTHSPSDDPFYYLFVAGSMAPTVIALVASHPWLLELLLRERDAYLPREP